MIDLKRQRRYEEVQREIFKIVKEQGPIPPNRLGSLSDRTEQEFGFVYGRVILEMLCDRHLYYTEDRHLKVASKSPLNNDATQPTSVVLGSTHNT
jgi:hypothetical protein